MMRNIVPRGFNNLNLFYDEEYSKYISLRIVILLEKNKRSIMSTYIGMFIHHRSTNGRVRILVMMRQPVFVLGEGVGA
jgi:hypothetical protein